MSAEALAIALHHSRARGTAKLVLIGIANHDGDGGSWPSMATLCKYAGGVDRTNVRDAVKKLVALGEVRVVENGGGQAHTPDYIRPNLYHFTLECPPTCDRSRQHRDTRAGARYVPRYLDMDGLDYDRGVVAPTGASARSLRVVPPGGPGVPAPTELNQELIQEDPGTEPDAGARAEGDVTTSAEWSALIDRAHGGRGIVTADLRPAPPCPARRSMPCSIHPKTHRCLDCGQAAVPWAQDDQPAEAVAS